MSYDGSQRSTGSSLFTPIYDTISDIRTEKRRDIRLYTRSQTTKSSEAKARGTRVRAMGEAFDNIPGLFGISTSSKMGFRFSLSAALLVEIMYSRY